jgi:hypothetical protein
VKIVDFQEDKNWRGTVIIYLNSNHSNNAIGRFERPLPWLEDGASLVEKMTDPVTVFEE